MFRLCAETYSENIPSMHNSVNTLTGHPLYRVGEELPYSVGCSLSVEHHFSKIH